MKYRNLIRGLTSLMMMIVLVGELLENTEDGVHDERHHKNKVVISDQDDSDKNRHLPMLDHITA